MIPHYVYDWTADVARYRNILGGPALTLEELILDAIDRHAIAIIIGSTTIPLEKLVAQYCQCTETEDFNE